MGSIFARPPVRAGVAGTPAPRVALVAHGGEGLEALAGAATLCLGAEREGLPAEVVAACDATATIPLAGGAESLNVAAAAAIACERLAALGGARISSLAMARSAQCLSRSRRSGSPAPRRSSPPPRAPSWRSCGSGILGRKAELTQILRGIAELPPEERGAVGGAANKARKELEALIEQSAERLDAAELDAKLVADRIDVTLPGAPPRPLGHQHLIARTTR